MLPIVETPRYTTTIPSTKETVEYRPYLVKEEKVLMMGLESGDESTMIKALRDVISACTMDKIDVGRLTMFDLEYLFTQLRIVSVGAMAKIGLKCESCEERNEINVDLSKIEVRGEYGTKIIEVTDNLKIELKFPNINELNETRKDGSTVDRIYSMLEKCIGMIYYGDEVMNAADYSSEEVKNFLESLPSSVFGQLRDFVEGTPYSGMDIKFDCLKCSHHNEMEIRGLQSFFG